MSKLRWLFSSRKGISRQENKDFLSIIEYGDDSWFFAFDIATSSPINNTLAQTFIQQLTAELKNHDLTCPVIRKQLIQHAFTTTKHELKLGKASYLSIFHSYSSGKLHCLVAGDCRAGIAQDNEIKWFTPVHTGANPFGEDFTIEMKELDERHLLTRSMNLRREFQPIEVEHHIDLDSILVIATDGFWVELDDDEQFSFIHKGQPLSEDDASVLLLSWPQESIDNKFKNNTESNLLKVKVAKNQ